MSRPKLSHKSLFLAAIEIESEAERAAFLQRACGDNDQLREEIESLLDAHGDPPDVLKKMDNVQATIDRPVTEQPGTIIGPYKLLQQIGEGGMGVVYMAEQTEPVRRKVALKIIKPGMDSKQVIARFEAEEQALALMDHPNIAKVLDAGTTDRGRPYFVMELVKGQPITEYCDQHRLTPRERLELFLPVCQAIQHAHQKGIIHRDIKPSNILVAEYDEQAVPKVIDFGVAKAVNQPLTEKTMFTALGQIVGTLEYMSPEQAKVNQLDIDTRTDVYALGVVLYELLTGTTPFDKQRLRSAAWDEMLRIIREEEPPKPSTRLSDSQTVGPLDLRRPPHRIRQADETGARGTRLDRDEGPGKGSGTAVRHGQRVGRRYRALLARRARGGLSAIGCLPLPQVRTAEQGGTRFGHDDSLDLAAGLRGGRREHGLDGPRPRGTAGAGVGAGRADPR